MSATLEFPLAQGWAKGLRFVFEDRAGSARLGRGTSFWTKQVHGRAMIEVTPTDLPRLGECLGEADGTWARGDWVRELRPRLMVRTADCAPILMVDHKNASVAALHAGWRGLQQGIHRVPFEELGFDPKTTWAWIGPCLNGASFEVDDDMRKLFPRAVAEDPRFFAPAPGGPTKRFFNSWVYLEEAYRALGVELAYNVEVDTFQAPEFASYRRAKRDGVELGQQNYSWLAFGP